MSKIERLSAVAAKAAKPKKNAYKLMDGGGLYLYVSVTGAKLWRYNYRFLGKHKTLSFGEYHPSDDDQGITLKHARELHRSARKLLSEGNDPALQKKLDKLAKKNNTFGGIAQEWFDKNKHKWADATIKKKTFFLERYLYPFLAERPITEIAVHELLDVLQRIEKQGSFETAHRVKQLAGCVFRYAISHGGRADRDITADLKGALSPVVTKHMAAITDPVEFGGLLRGIDDYSGSFVVKCAFRLQPYLFLRPGELRHMEWKEINFKKKELRIPASKMKMKQEHIVHLSRQAIGILKEVRPFTCTSPYVFPSARTMTRPMSENAVTAALRRMGYSGEEMTVHGFRTSASTMLNEQGYNRDWIERSLSHSEKDKIRGAYNRALFLAERKIMLDEWADYIDQLREG